MPAAEHPARHVRRDVQGEGRIGRRGVQEAVLHHVPRAVPALLARLEHEHHRAGEPSRWAHSRRPRRPAWRRGCRGRRHASLPRCARRSRGPCPRFSGRASMSPRSTIVRLPSPAPVPSMTAVTEVVERPGTGSRPRLSKSLVYDNGLGLRELEPDLGDPGGAAGGPPRSEGRRAWASARSGWIGLALAGHGAPRGQRGSSPDSRTPASCRAPADGTMPRLVGPSSVDEGGRSM